MNVLGRIPNGFPLDGDLHNLPPLPVWHASVVEDIPEPPTFSEARGFTARLDRMLFRGWS